MRWRTSHTLRIRYISYHPGRHRSVRGPTRPILPTRAEEPKARRGERPATVGARRGGGGHGGLGRHLGAMRQPAAQAVLVKGVVTRRHVPPLPLLARLLADGAGLLYHISHTVAASSTCGYSPYYLQLHAWQIEQAFSTSCARPPAGWDASAACAACICAATPRTGVSSSMESPPCASR